MELVLCWRGPAGAGLFPDDADAREELSAPGVYLRVKQYQGSRTVAYVGQSKNLLARFDQHLTRTLSLASALRDEAGTPVTVEGGDRLALLNALEAAGPLALAEAARMRFYFALAADGFDEAYLTLLEALLKARAETRLAGACENIQPIAIREFDHDIAVISDVSLLDAASAAIVRSIVGEDDIVVPAAETAFDHAG